MIFFTKITFLVFALSFHLPLMAQTIWDGPPITFEKADGADWNLEENQDRITDDVWITRANIKGIFNIATENDYQNFSSPAGTEWAFGTTDDLENLTFNNWEATVGNPPSSVGQDMVLHLIEEDIYINITFTSWANGMQGGEGGFAYERSTEAVSSTETLNQPDAISAFPIPAKDYLTLQGNIFNERYELVNSQGQLISSGTVAPNKQIDVRQLSPGTYFIRLENGQTLRFLK